MNKTQANRIQTAAAAAAAGYMGEWPSPYARDSEEKTRDNTLLITGFTTLVAQTKDH